MGKVLDEQNVLRNSKMLQPTVVFMVGSTAILNMTLLSRYYSSQFLVHSCTKWVSLLMLCYKAIVFAFTR